MARILAVWELGGSLGHVRRLAPLLEALVARGHEVEVAVRDLGSAQVALSGFPLHQAPLPQAARRIARPQSMSEILQTDGVCEPGALSSLLAQWSALFDRIDPDLIVLDYAPNALFAAVGAGCPVAQIGTGFTLPPNASPLPDIRVAEGGYPDRLRLMEADVLAAVTAARAAIGLKTPDSLGAVFAMAEGQVLATWPELDPFAALRPADSWTGPWSRMGSGEALPWPDGNGPRVLAYLKPSAAAQTVIARLAQIGAPTLCFVSGSATEIQSPVPSMTITPRPLNLAALLDSAQIGICHAGHGTTAAMLGAGVPALLLPMQIEQMLTAKTVSAHGASVWADARDGGGARTALDRLLGTHRAAAQATDLYRRRRAARDDAATLAAAVALLEDLLPLR